MRAGVLVLVPAYNEAPVIGGVVQGLRRAGLTTLVIDDGSSDGTALAAQLAGASVVRHSANLGQGAALATGLAAACQLPWVKCVVTFDADGQHSPSDASALLDRLGMGDVDVVLGTRFAGGACEAGWLKRLVLRGAALLTRLDTRVPVSDAANGLRAMTIGFARNLVITQHGMGHASEIIARIGAAGASWAEVPVHVSYTDYSRAKGQPLINSVNILFDAMLR